MRCAGPLRIARNLSEMGSSCNADGPCASGGEDGGGREVEEHSATDYRAKMSHEKIDILNFDTSTHGEHVSRLDGTHDV